MTQSETTSAAGGGETGLRKALNDAAFSIDGIGGAATPTPKLLRILADHLDGIRRIENVPGCARNLRGRADFLDETALAARAALAAPTAKGGTEDRATSLIAKLARASERLRDNPIPGMVEGDLYVAVKNEGEGTGWRYVCSGALVSDLDEARVLASPLTPAGAAGGGSGDTNQIVDWTELNRLFAQIPDGPWLVIRSSNHEIRQIDTNPTNKHHWPFRLCQSIVGRQAACDDAVFDFLAGVLNAWPQISASMAAGGGSGDLAALSAGATPEIKATQITLGEGLVDIGPITHEGRVGVLFRPRAEHIPFGQAGELQECAYWPGPNDVVLWVSGEGPQVAIDALAALAPTPDLGAQGETVAGDTVVVPRLCDIEALPAYYAVLDSGSRCEEITVRAINAYVEKAAAPAAPRTGSGVSAEEIEKLCDRLDRLNTISEPQACADVMDEARLMILALFAQAPRDGGETQGGWRLVPEEPTDAMISAAETECRRAAGVLDPVMHVWDAMLAAAPTPPSGVETGGSDA